MVKQKFIEHFCDGNYSVAQGLPRSNTLGTRDVQFSLSHVKSYVKPPYSVHAIELNDIYNLTVP